MRARWWNLVKNSQCISKSFCILQKGEWVKNRSGTNGVPFFLCACFCFSFLLLCFIFLKLQSLLQAWSPFQQPVWLEHKLSKREPTPIPPVVDKGLLQWRCQLLEMLSTQGEWLWYVFNFPLIFLKVKLWGVCAQDTIRDSCQLHMVSLLSSYQEFKLYKFSVLVAYVLLWLMYSCTFVLLQQLSSKI